MAKNPNLRLFCVRHRVSNETAKGYDGNTVYFHDKMLAKQLRNALGPDEWKVSKGPDHYAFKE